MFWDDLVRRWRRESKVLSPRLLRGAAGNVAVLPAPLQQRRRRWLVLLVMLVLLGAALLVSTGRGTVVSSVEQSTPAATLALPG